MNNIVYSSAKTKEPIPGTSIPCAQLSSFAYAPMYIDGRMFATAEHAFQHYKCDDEAYQSMFDMTRTNTLEMIQKWPKSVGERHSSKERPHTSPGLG